MKSKRGRKRKNFKKTPTAIVVALLFAALSLFAAGCNNDAEPVDYSACRVVVESGRGYSVKDPVKEVRRGEDAQFQITLEDGAAIQEVGYPDYALLPTRSGATLKIKNVRYPTVVTLKISLYSLSYYANGGIRKDGGDSSEPVRAAASQRHLRVNTAWGTQLFEREGYVFTGWNTKPDGSGNHYGPGSRAERVSAEKGLYAEWSKESPAQLFAVEKKGGRAVITAYLGAENSVTVPRFIDGLPAVGIEEFAFKDCAAEKIVLSENISFIAPRAFSNCAVKTLYMFDSVGVISDESFSGCDNLATLHLGATQSPVYSGTYFDTFSDKLDKLASMENQKKIVLYSGSSARFGYDSPKIDAAFPSYGVVNMGVYAYSHALPQLEIIRSYMREGDVLLSAPEFDAVDTQFCVFNEFDVHTFAMTEACFDALSRLDLRKFDKVFDSMSSFLTERVSMDKKSYSISAADNDENGDPAGYVTYNEYGDFIFLRPNSEKDEMHRQVRCDYTVKSFPEYKVNALNRAYRPFIEDGVRVYFSFAPRNRSSLTYESTPHKRAELESYLCSLIEVPVISELEEYMYSGIYFYEIDNHLSDEGVQLRTTSIIRDLKEQLKKDGLEI